MENTEEGVSFADAPPNHERAGTSANERHLWLVGGTDRDRSELRRIAAAALGFIVSSDSYSAAELLRDFLCDQ
jgi:hypothetical protein